MALAKDTPGKPLGGHWVDYPMAASVTIYEGGFVGDNGSGYARALTAGDPFLGIAQKGCVETTATAGGQFVRVRTGTWRQEFALAGAITDIGKVVYATDDGTLSLTAGTNTPVGRVVRYVTAALMEIEFTTSPTTALIRTTNDLEIKSNDDLTLSPGKLAADSVYVTGWDIDATAAVNLIAAKSHATVPQLILGASAAGNSIGFFGSTGSTQLANIAAAATDATSATSIATTLNAVIAGLKSYFLVATA